MTASFWNALIPSQPLLSRIEVDGIPTRVLEAGPRLPAEEDEAIILVHGASGHLESFVFTLPVLAQGRRTIAYDLPFHGYAGYAGHPFSVPEHARYLAALAEMLGVGKVSLVGQSLGLDRLRLVGARPGRNLPRASGAFAINNEGVFGGSFFDSERPAPTPLTSLRS